MQLGKLHNVSRPHFPLASCEKNCVSICCNLRYNQYKSISKCTQVICKSYQLTKKFMITMTKKEKECFSPEKAVCLPFRQVVTSKTLNQQTKSAKFKNDYACKNIIQLLLVIIAYAISVRPNIIYYLYIHNTYTCRCTLQNITLSKLHRFGSDHDTTVRIQEVPCSIPRRAL